MEGLHGLLETAADRKRVTKGEERFAGRYSRKYADWALRFVGTNWIGD